jgi:hypothetical protein
MSHPRLLRPALSALLLALLVAAPLLAAGYTIYLKDGSHVVAKEKYRIENGRAIITLLNGTQTFVPASQIDAKRTEEVNRSGYGSAVVLPGTPQEVGQAPAEPRKEKTLADLIAARAAAPRELPGSRRATADSAPGRLTRTKAGYVDFATLARKPYSHAEVTAELQQFFRGQGIEGVEIHDGSRGDHPLIEITTNSEGSVFQALTTAANALLHLRGLFPSRVAAFDLLLSTPARERAGQFVLTPELASDLVSKRVDVTSFFVKNVQF